VAWWSDVQPVLDHLVARVVGGDRLLFAGNGGSAADAQHLAAEYIGVGLPAMALTTDTSVLTALANDFGYDQVIARQLDAVGRAGDVLILHSTSGESANLIRAIEVAWSMEITTVAVVARGGGRMARAADFAIVVPTDDTQLAQEIHLAVGHVLWGQVRNVMGV